MSKEEDHKCMVPDQKSSLEQLHSQLCSVAMIGYCQEELLT